MNLFVANISRTVTENALKALFSEFGKITSVKIVTDKYTGESKGFGFVDMQDDREAIEAIKRLSQVSFFGTKLLVSKARPKMN
ncbi:MAG TPA: RNA-binding protein [Ohtaekwangia sp.]|uniref:RNA recognition motif domain-containing protein n=1 Tax=Ohtaekwangia sp. TaxID=2066019 RepID=UPI002F925F19